MIKRSKCQADIIMLNIYVLSSIAENYIMQNMSKQKNKSSNTIFSNVFTKFLGLSTPS